LTSLRSPSWYRVAELKPRLRPHALIHRQRERGQLWYVMQDRQSGRFHRLSPAAHHVTCLMDGRRTIDKIWTLVAQRYGDDPPTQDEIIRLLAQLHAADLLIGGVPPHFDELAERAKKHARRTLLQKISSPLAIRIPLLDPHRFLTATMPLVRPLFTWFGFVLWTGVVAAGITLAAMNWPALTHNVVDRALSAQGVALLLVLYPLVKALHELGHAYASERWDGEVHEIGVMLLVLLPVPYVDASASSAFPEKWRRVVVGAAGMMVETFLAAIAMIVWVTAEHGLVRAAAFDVMLICGVSTVLFNGNPLLRFDGYYILADIIETPNLATRANRYFFYLVRRYAFGVTDATSPATAPGEAPWFTTYAIASFFYRTTVMLGIALFVGTKLFFVGVALALFTLLNGLVFPVVKGLRYLMTSQQLARHRMRATAVSFAALAGLLALLFALPLPHATVAQGVVVVPERSAVRARNEGEVLKVWSGGRDGLVAAGTTLVSLADSTLAAQTDVVAAQLEVLRMRLDVVKTSDLVQANILREQIRQSESRLALNRKRLADLDIVAEQSGRLVFPVLSDLPGRFVRKGDLLGYVVGDSDSVVRVVIPQADVELVRDRTVRIDARFVDHIAQVVPAQLVREVPAAQADLPSLALSTRGGGEIALDPGKTDAPRALETQFQFELRTPSQRLEREIGGRVYVRFDHGLEPIAWRVIRSGRQIFLRHFGV
jgi:putative peptide zinc metalloprotease protein